MATIIQIINGNYRGQDVAGKQFEMLTPFKIAPSGGFVTVRNSGQFPGLPSSIRIKMDSASYNIVSGGQEMDYAVMNLAQTVVEHVPVVPETDEEIMDRIHQRFDVVDQITQAVIDGHIRSLIITGPAGVGKSYGVTSRLDEAENRAIAAGRSAKFTVIKGKISPLGLYMDLYRHSDDSSIMVLDDCDGYETDEVMMNLLKSALDTSEKRIISWNTTTKILEDAGIPTTFTFRGSMIFITNKKFDNIKNETMRAHFMALQSRSHFVDLEIDTKRELMLRIRQVHRDSDLFKNYELDEEQQHTALEFIAENYEKFQHLSIRTPLKIGDLMKVSKHGWRDLAKITLMKNR